MRHSHHHIDHVLREINKHFIPEIVKDDQIRLSISLCNTHVHIGGAGWGVPNSVFNKKIRAYS